MDKPKLKPAFPDTLGASIYRLCESSDDIETKIRYIDQLIEYSPFITASEKQHELITAIRFLNQGLDTIQDEKLKHRFTILMKEFVDAVDWEEFDFKIGDITRNISPQDDGLTLAWLDTFEDIGDKTCLGKVK
ncbi:MAG: hypothetical protein K6C40_03640 [Thermoguttaceae bacterium]|nr:hypothetical protein [Thermoguttaceae bacterium]